MELNRANMRKLAGLVAFGVLLFAATLHYQVFLEIFDWLFAILEPVTIGLCIAFVLNVVMRVFETRLFKGLATAKSPLLRKLLRPVSLIATLLLVLGIIVAVPLVMIPQLKEALTILGAALPDFFNSIIDWVQKLFLQLNIDSDFIANLEVNWNSIFNYVKDLVVSGSSLLLGTATGVTASVFSVLGNVMLGIVIAIYILAMKERVASFTNRLAKALLPQRAYNGLMHVLKVAYDSFSSFIAGQLTEAVILGTLCFIGMTIFGFPYAGAISVLIAVTAVIPIIGALIGEAVGVFLILMVNPLQALLFLVYVLSLQALEGNFIYPKVVGKSVGLPGLLVLVSVIVGGNIGGVMGVLLAVPVCSILYALAREFISFQEAKDAKRSAITVPAPPSPPEYHTAPKQTSAPKKSNTKKKK